MMTANLERRLAFVAGRTPTLKRAIKKSKKAQQQQQNRNDTDGTAEADAPVEPEAKEDDGGGGEPDGDEQKSAADGPGTVEGYAAVFYSESDPGSEYELWSDPTMRVVERIARGAFSRACREDDVRALYNHEHDNLLGRTGSGTCRLAEDEKGLAYSVDLPDTTLGRDVAELVGRGDVSGSSFGFVVEQESWRETKEEGGSWVAVRTIEGVRLLDVGPVTYPAYSSTTSGRKGREDDAAPHPEPDGDEEGKSRSGGGGRAVGSIAEARASYERWKRSSAATVPLQAKLAAARARAVEVASA